MPCPPSPKPSPTPGPEPTALTFLLIRIGAFTYDALLVAAIWVFTITLLVTVSGQAVTGAWVQSVLFMELYAFFAFFWIMRGQTLGMLAWRLELRARDGRLTLRHALLRFIGGLACLASGGIGYLWMMVDPGKRTWGDLLSKTYMVRVPKRARRMK